MSLDNYPVPRPCEARDPVVVRREWNVTDGESEAWTEQADVIDCAATADAGRCPWAAADRPGIPSYGMGGQPCWLRGGFVAELISALGGDGDILYDDLPPAKARSLADWMGEQDAEARLRLGDEHAQWVYAAWWLRWCADHDTTVIGWS